MSRCYEEEIVFGSGPTPAGSHNPFTRPSRFDVAKASSQILPSLDLFRPTCTTRQVIERAVAKADTPTGRYGPTGRATTA
jgi:hypothetical protein